MKATIAEFLTAYTKKIVHNPLERQQILHDGIAELEAHIAELIQAERSTT